MKRKIDITSTIYSDSWRGYTGLVDVGYDKHLRINHTKDEFSNKRGRAAAGKSVVLGLLERDGRVYTRIVHTLTAEHLMSIIKKKTRKGSVYHTVKSLLI